MSYYILVSEYKPNSNSLRFRSVETFDDIVDAEQALKRLRPLIGKRMRANVFGTGSSGMAPDFPASTYTPRPRKAIPTPKPTGPPAWLVNSYLKELKRAYLKSNAARTG